jgi:hypothetical protein
LPPRRRILACLVATLGLAAILHGQSASWFKDPAHDKTNRWEGLLGEDQDSPSWQFRSFVGDVEPYPLTSAVDLTISYYVPDATPAFVIAKEIDPLLQYLMRPKPMFLQAAAGWRQFTGWSTKDVLVPRQIPSTNLAVLIRVGADSAAVNRFAPAIVRYSTPLPASLKTYRLDFFTERAIAAFSFDVIGEKGYRKPYPNQRAVGDRSVVHLSFDAASIPEGRTRVLLNALYSNAPVQKLPIECEFYQKAP